MKLIKKLTSAELITDRVIGLFSYESLVAVYNTKDQQLWKLIDLHKSPENSLRHVQNMAASLDVPWENVRSTTQITLQKILVKGLADEL